MQRFAAPCIKQFTKNSNFNLLTEKLQQGIEMFGTFFVFGLIYQTKKNKGGGYKQMNARLARGLLSICLSHPEFNREIGLQKQKLSDKLSTYTYMTPYRLASMKRHGQTGGWLTTYTEFTDWMTDPGPSIFILSGKRGFFIQDQYSVYG